MPLIILEPVKPLGTYLIATGHFRNGVAVIVIGEILKVVVVERLFQINREKLLSIPAFAWVYYLVIGWLDWLKQLPAWQALERRFRLLKAAAKALSSKIIHRVRKPSAP